MKSYELKQMKEFVHAKHKNRIFTPEETVNGYWQTYVSDSTKARGRRKITRKQEEDFYHELYDFYHGAGIITPEKQKQKMTLNELYPQWLEKKREETTAENYIRRINNDWVKYYKDSKIVYQEIVDIKSSDIEKWLLHIARGQGHGISKTAYYNITIILRQMMEYAHRLGITEHNTFSDAHVDTKNLLRLRRKKPDTEEVFTNQEIAKIKSLCWDDYTRPDYHTRQHLTPLAVLFELQTGLRIGELCALRWEDITPGFVYIRRMYRYETREIVSHGKTNNAERKIPLTNEAKGILDECMNFQATHDKSTTGYIFSETSGPLPPPVVNKFMRKVCSKIGGHLRNTHKLRKTVISALVDSKTNLETIRRLCGHSDARTTLDAYVYDRDLDSDRLSKIDEALQFNDD